MMRISFDKYQATGNDFVMLDNRDGVYDGLTTETISALCHRRFGIGADGVILLGVAEGFDFEMVYYNANGSLGSMCGNGARCITAFAKQSGISRNEYKFLAYDGAHFSSFTPEGEVRLKMNRVTGISRDSDAFVLDTGSPHYVLQVDDLENLDVFNKGRAIRYSEPYKEKGINVNFISFAGDGSIVVRTYERGVENETYSCGTGVTAAAISSAGEEDGNYEFDITTRGGSLHVSYEKEGNVFDNIWLSGPAVRVFSGEINV